MLVNLTRTYVVQLYCRTVLVVSVRVAVFARGANAEAAKAAGAELVGMEDLADQIKKGEMNFDVVIASPDAMRVVGQLGQVLGPRGLMPNPKVGTVTLTLLKRLRTLKQVRFVTVTTKTASFTLPSVKWILTLTN